MPNVWQTDRIARIDPASGKVVGWIDLTGLLNPSERRSPDNVLNGIAYDAAGDRLFVTGKRRPKLFEIRLVKKTGPSPRPRRSRPRRENYNRTMKVALLSLLTFSLSLSAQPVSGREALETDLQYLHRPAPITPEFIGQVGAHILMMAQKTHAPKAPTVQQFAQGLVTALAGHSPAQHETDGMAADIEQTLQSAGTSTVGFEGAVRDFERRLMRAAVPAVRAHLVASSLERIGREVRGPEDAPVK